MSKKGVSAADKRTRMLELLHESNDFFVLKELEKLAPKQKGIVAQSVKDVLTELHDDDLIEIEKIGTSNYYWSFPYTATAAKQASLKSKTAELESLKSSVTQLQMDLSDARKGREETAERASLLAQHQSLLEREQQLNVALKRYESSDPEAYEKKKRAVEVAREEACKWTENTLLLLQYIKNHSGMSEGEVRGSLGVGEDWEDGYC